MGFGPSWLSNSLGALNAGSKVLDGGADSLDLSALKLQNIKAAFDEAQNVLKDPGAAADQVVSDIASTDAAAASAATALSQATADEAAAAAAAAAGAAGADQQPKIPFLDITTPFAKDLTIQSFRGEEGLSMPFHFSVECRSTKSTLDFKKILGKQVTLKLGIGDNFRYINGVVTRFMQAGTFPDQTVYLAEIRPWFWLLTQTRDSRIFQQKSVPDIIEAVFKAYGFEKHKKSLTGSYSPRDYTVQHQESDYDFVCRLMEDEGIFYFFEHTDSDHTLVLVDDASAHKAITGLDKAVYNGLNSPFAVDQIQFATLEQQITTNAYTMSDYNFETPKTSLLSKVKGSSPALEIYEYPGGYSAKSDGDNKIKPRIEAHEEGAVTFRGESRIRSFIPGFKFKVGGHARDDANDEYVLRWVSHNGSNQQYSNMFDALPSKTTFKPPAITRKPRVAGSETAIVVGKSGEEIWTDKYGRIKVQFAWDRLGKNDDKSSCWVRVAQNWAGKQWGTWFLPRIGMEVIVTYIDGDPDRPLVTGAVYNGENTLPYALPDNQTKSTTKTNSSKGGGGFNEVRFEDKKDSEEIFIQAQKDMNVWVKNDRTTKIDHDETVTVKQDRKITITDGDTYLTVKTGNRKVDVKTNDVLKVKGTRDVKVTGDETHENSANYKHTVSGDYVLKVSGAMSVTVGGKLTIKGSNDIAMQSDTNVKMKAGIGFNIQGTTVDVKASATGTVDGGGMLTIKGAMVKIN